MTDSLQLMPPLAPEEYEGLKGDILKRGIQIPILIDEEGNVLDGHHRRRIAAELGIECPRETRSGLSNAEKVELAIGLNINRRHLTQEQRRALVAKQLSIAPEKSDRQIAETLGLTHPTVSSVRRAMEESGDVEKVSTRTDSRGRRQPATKPRPLKSAKKSTKEPAPLDAEQVKERFAAACMDVRKVADKLTDHEAFEVVQRARDTLIRLLPRLKPPDAKAIIAKIRECVGEVT